jgi:hypothetical protein
MWWCSMLLAHRDVPRNCHNDKQGATRNSQAYASIASRSPCLLFILKSGLAMAEAVSRRPLTAEARVRSLVGSCGICGGQSGTRTGFSASTSVSPCQFHSTSAP